MYTVTVNGTKVAEFKNKKNADNAAFDLYEKSRVKYFQGGQQYNGNEVSDNVCVWTKKQWEEKIRIG